jgi:superfamily I DNA/RNA helicase
MGRSAPKAPGGDQSTAVDPSILASLDDDQRAAASILHGPVLIAAGPGSGKTRTLTHRIAHLVADHGVPASGCLAITFTRRAAAEMRERLTQLLPHGGAEAAVHTFHSLALMILREHPDAAGLHRAFRIASEAERVAALAEALAINEARAQRLLRAISKAKRTQATASAEIEDARTAYDAALAVRNWIDFDDVIALALRALENGLAAHYRECFRFISVDEFQDVDEPQYRMVSALAPPGANLCVIGDANQAIYGFRGADSSCFARFMRDYRPAVVALKRNYRSSGTIVAASAQMIASQQDEPIATIVRDMHERIAIRAAPTERAEAEFVIQTIEALIGGHTFFSIDSGRAKQSGENLSFADIAVLYRTAAQSDPLAEAFSRSGIPFKKNSHQLIADDPAVRALLNGLDAASDQPLSDQLRAAERAARGADIADTALQTALQRLTALARTSEGDRTRFLDTVATATEADFRDARADCVSLLTLHAAKGLEFSLVFIVGLEDGLLPLHWGEPDDATTAEERRLFYVGMTRAKDRLILSRALARHWRGRVRQLPPSPFLADIESELVKHQRAEGLRRKPEDRQLKLL